MTSNTPLVPVTNAARATSERIRKAIILAAGVGDRLRPFTHENPKCLAEVTGVPILENALKHLASLGTEEVVIVVGHHKERIIETVGSNYLGMSIVYVVSKDYATTNNIYSLWLARAHLEEDVLLLFRARGAGAAALGRRGQPGGRLPTPGLDVGHGGECGRPKPHRGAI